MRMRIGAAFLWAAPLLLGSPAPADWVPARWTSPAPQSLELLTGTPINCLLVKTYTPEFAAAAAQRGIVTLALLTPGSDAVAEARKALAAHLNGVVLEGEFPPETAGRVKDALSGTKAAVVQLSLRSSMRLDGTEPVVGTFQGVWPGIQVQEDGHAKAGPSGTPWIDTNSGFIRSARARTGSTLWLANQPPPKYVITSMRYRQVIADAAMNGARWVVALDTDFNARLLGGDAAALRDWKLMAQVLAYFEKHREWRELQEAGRLAVVQDAASGGLLSGGIIDMIATRHAPVRPVPLSKLTPEALKGASMAVNVDPEALTPAQKEILRAFTRGGATVLSGPPGWKAPTSKGDAITLDKDELNRLGEIWKDVQTLIGRRNLGARLFNVSSMLSNLMEPPDGKQVILHLVNYSDYSVENIAVHFLGRFKSAKLLTPEGETKELEIYQTEEGSGVDIDKITVCATLRLE